MQKNIITYAKELIHLALPIIMGHIGFTFIVAGDVFVAGKYSTDALAAVSLSGAVTSIVFMFGIGLIVSVSPVLANRLGEKKSVKKYFFPTILFSQVIAFFIMLAVMGCIPLMEHMGFDEKLIPDIRSYTFLMAFSAFGAYLHCVLKEFLQAYEIVFFPNFLAIIGIFLNLIVNWIFVFGYGPIPSFGTTGLAISTIIIRGFIGLALLIFCLVKFKFINSHFSQKYFKTLIKVGFPISIAVCLEFIAFNSMSVLMGRVNGIYAAAQNIINVIASASFMIPLSISNAIAVKVGFANGAKNLQDIKNYSIAGVVCSVGFMAFCGILFALFPAFFAEIFTSDVALVDIIVPVMIIVAIFQVFDGLQCSLAGILKGLKRTKMVSFANLIGYILIGISLGSFMAFKMHMNLFGFWMGIFVASICVGTMLLTDILFAYKRLQKEFEK